MSNTWETILSSPTPKAWIEKALDSLEILLTDHAHCEKKAATTAISLMQGCGLFYLILPKTLHVTTP